MTYRRFTDKPDLNPEAVRDLPLDNAAILQGRTLFPSTVIEVTETEPERLLVSGQNNRKLGEIISKGKHKGAALFQLSLEERATCNSDCELFRSCYGNGMQFGRRLRIGDSEVFYDRLSAELGDLLREHGKIMVRLHVLGDFPSAEYVHFWEEMLDCFEGDLSCFGYTRWRPDDKIGIAIEAAKIQYPDLFRIRWSGVQGDDGSVVIDRMPEGAVVDEGIVCPAQTDATACCASCALCWDSTKNTIVFVKHGPANQGKLNQDALSKSTMSAVDGFRPVAPIELPKKLQPAVLVANELTCEWVAPTDLFIEEAYQRGLTVRSLGLIRKIVSGWDWTKYKPPICSLLPGGKLAVIDGQHTAIAAASHGEIGLIPVMITTAARLEKRAESFVAHNKDRLAMSSMQVFHAQLAAGDPVVMRAATWAHEVGGQVPRNPPQKGYERKGDIIPVAELTRFAKKHSKNVFQDIIAICVLSGHAPIGLAMLRSVEMILTQEYFAQTAKAGIEKIAVALGSIESPDAASRVAAAETGQVRFRALAVMIRDRVDISTAKGVAA